MSSESERAEAIYMAKLSEQVSLHAFSVLCPPLKAVESKVGQRHLLPETRIPSFESRY